MFSASPYWLALPLPCSFRILVGIGNGLFIVMTQNHTTIRKVDRSWMDLPFGSDVDVVVVPIDNLPQASYRIRCCIEDSGRA